MNEFLKVIFVLLTVVFMLIFNTMVVDVVLGLDYDYFKNLAWRLLLALSLTLMQVVVFRIIIGKLKIRVTWE